MSHLSDTPVRLDSKEGLKKACELIPEFHFHDTKTFFAYEDRECDFCVSIDGARYQIGFKRMLDGTLKPLVDWYSPGGLEAALGGKDMARLRAAHNVGKLAVEAEKYGHSFIVGRTGPSEYKLFSTTKKSMFHRLKEKAKGTILKHHL